MSTESESEKKPTRQRYVLILLIIICITPVIGPWLLINFTDVKDVRGMINHGELIQPPRPLPDIELFNPEIDKEGGSLHGKWSLLYLLKDRCNDACEENLYKMRQLEAATGKHSHRVQRVLLSYGQNRNLLSTEQVKLYERQLVATADSAGAQIDIQKFVLVEGDLPLQAGRLYIVDPLGNLMMSYWPEAEPAGIIKDLKRLLKYSKIG